MSTAPQPRIAEGVIERLPLYLGVLMQLRRNGEATVSSARLGEITGVNPAQIRRDLTRFGSFGKRGVGYEVPVLLDEIQRILGADHVHRIALVGAGNLGSAIAHYDGLRHHGFLVSALFDADPRKVGTRVGDLLVSHVNEIRNVVADQDISIGIIAVPSAAAQDAADRLVAAGVRIIVNYTSVIVDVPDNVTLHNTDPVRELLYTLYFLSKSEDDASR